MISFFEMKTISKPILSGEHKKAAEQGLVLPVLRQIMQTEEKQPKLVMSRKSGHKVKNFCNFALQTDKD